MEHEVIFDHQRQVVLKVTLPGMYGNTLRFRNGTVGLGPATPLEYLDRWALSNELFEDEASVLGLVQNKAGVRLAVAQPLVVGQRPERDEISLFMSGLGFERVRDTNLFFDFNRDLLVGDAHPGNFLRNEDGQIFAIDVLPVKATGSLLSYALGF